MEKTIGGCSITPKPTMIDKEDFIIFNHSYDTLPVFMKDPTADPISLKPREDKFVTDIKDAIDWERMKWFEDHFKFSLIVHKYQDPLPEYSCDCGGKLKQKMILTSYPAQFQFECENCDAKMSKMRVVFESELSKKLKKMQKENKTCKTCSHAKITPATNKRGISICYHPWNEGIEEQRECGQQHWCKHYSLVGFEFGTDRFKILSEGIILDTKTGKEWYTGPDEDTSHYEAERWVEELNIAGGNWRMPTVDELKSLYEKGKGNRNLDLIFKMIGWFVWTATLSEDSSYAWDFNFNGGNKFWRPRVYSYYYRAFAVRSGR